MLRKTDKDGRIIKETKGGIQMRDKILLNEIKESMVLPKGLEVEVYSTVDSTNTVALRRLREGCGEWHTVIAEEQTGGQGRMGRSFFSPKGTGLYMSTVLYPDPEKALLITGMAAVAVCEALEACFGISPKIKWVNDIVVDSKKICGILAKAVSVGEKMGVILGIGINVYCPNGGFPDEISGIAGYLFEKEESGIKAHLSSAILSKLYERYSSIGRDDAPLQYRKRCLTVGRDVTVVPCEDTASPRRARATDTDGRYRLTVEYGDGSVETLSSGEVSVKI